MEVELSGRGDCPLIFFWLKSPAPFFHCSGTFGSRLLRKCSPTVEKASGVSVRDGHPFFENFFSPPYFVGNPLEVVVCLFVFPFNIL